MAQALRRVAGQFVPFEPAATDEPESTRRSDNGCAVVVAFFYVGSGTLQLGGLVVDLIAGLDGATCWALLGAVCLVFLLGHRLYRGINPPPAEDYGPGGAAMQRAR